MAEHTGPCCQIVQSMTRIPSSGIGMWAVLRSRRHCTARRGGRTSAPGPHTRLSAAWPFPSVRRDGVTIALLDAPTSDLTATAARMMDHSKVNGARAAYDNGGGGFWRLDGAAPSAPPRLPDDGVEAFQQGRHADAERLLVDALQRAERERRQQSPAVATRSPGWPISTAPRRATTEAEPLYQRAIALEEAAARRRARGTWRACSTTWRWSTAPRASTTQAEPLCQRALAIAERAHGGEHPLTARRSATCSPSTSRSSATSTPSRCSAARWRSRSACWGPGIRRWPAASATTPRSCARRAATPRRRRGRRGRGRSARAWRRGLTTEATQRTRGARRKMPGSLQRASRCVLRESGCWCWQRWSACCCSWAGTMAYCAVECRWQRRLLLVEIRLQRTPACSCWRGDLSRWRCCGAASSASERAAQASLDGCARDSAARRALHPRRRAARRRSARGAPRRHLRPRAGRGRIVGRTALAGDRGAVRLPARARRLGAGSRAASRACRSTCRPCSRARPAQPRPQSKDERLDLRRTDLRGADLNGVDFSRADLYEAHLEGASLQGAHLAAADLRGAHLSNADLVEANLQAAPTCARRISSRRISSRRISKARISAVRIWPARISAARTSRVLISAAAHLDGAYLYKAHLEGASLHGARVVSAIGMHRDERERINRTAAAQERTRRRCAAMVRCRCASRRRAGVLRRRERRAR